MPLPGSFGRLVQVILVVAVACGVCFSQGPPTPSPDKKASEVYGNIQVLKDVPSDQLIPAMQFITSSLGVQCGYCHVEHAFDKDEKKPKLTARKMMQMMSAINRNNFEGKQQVTCYSCHRGSPMPVSVPAIPESQAPLLTEAVQPSRPNPPNLPKAPEIIAKYVDAEGGAQAISKLTSLDEKGMFEAGGRHFPVDVLVLSPNQIAIVTHFPNGEGSTIYDGHSGWYSFPGRPARPMTPGDRDASRMDADLHLALDLNSNFSELRTEREVQINGKSALMVVGKREKLPPVEMYFDKQSGLLIRSVRYAQSPLGRNPTQIDYSDYRDVSGVKLPFHWTSATPTGRFTIQLESAQANVPISDDKFAKPTAAR
jgi:hypothetical protein